MSISQKHSIYFYTLSLILQFLSIISITNAALTTDEIDEFRVEVLNLIDTFGNTDDDASQKPLIGSILRLVFHDCAGPYNTGDDVSTLDNAIRLCDGCIDLENPDHSGLKELAQEPIEPLCDKWSASMNRADCWITIGNIALEYSASLSSTAGTLPPLEYKFGRYLCSTSPDAVTNLETGGTEFPLAHLGWDPLFEFFKDHFGFTKQESAVLIGAHTVGRAHKSGSGFEGKWTHDTFAFNNQFFIELLNKNNQWDQVTKTSPFPQWSNMGRATGEDELMMLNSDIGVVAAMEDTDDIDEISGVVSCRWEGYTHAGTYDTCPREETFDVALNYARDNQLFLDDFVLAWNKILSYNQFNLVTVNANPFVDTRDDSSEQSTPRLITNNCCIAKKIPNWNGRCWTAQSEQECIDVAPGKGSRCHWDPANCRPTQTCLLRGESCNNGGECCSKYCRSDTGGCR